MSASETAQEPARQEPEQKPQAQAEERPRQQEELLCTICGMRSCWR